MELLDDIGWMILRELQADARLSFTELGRRIGMSAPAVAERVRRMEEAGIITGYRAVVDPYKVGAAMLVMIRLTAAGGQYQRLIDTVQQMEEVLECYRVTGTDCLLMKVAVSSVKHLEQLIQQLVPFGHVNSSVVLSSPVQYRLFTRPVSDMRSTEPSPTSTT
jgi:Lrp/AsnC family leucine-responsive transcriptional regulator